ncbi:MAG: MBL fold metallo-hydrolase [Phycisphaeraceae bacterium]|nr:MBL fold metallo-hydrolase [Phycisphaeraceae bacterium]
MSARSRLQIQGVPLGPFETNCYVVSEIGSTECFIVDAGFGSAQLAEIVREGKLKPIALVLTHAHLDHIAGARLLRETFPELPIWIHENETQWLLDPELNLSAAAGMPVTAPKCDRGLRDGDQLDLPGGPWKVLHTPGHSPGSVTLWSANHGVAFVGDALFAGSIGRTDFPGCSFQDLSKSIRERLYTLPPETRCFPGHGPQTDIGREMKSNPFVRP